jgi:hypothetical protein
MAEKTTTTSNPFKENPILEQSSGQKIIKWFGKDEAMTFTALAYHKKLLREGFDPKSDEYYEEINSYIKESVSK